MKRILAIVLSLVMVVTMVGCGKADTSDASQNNSAVASSTDTADSQAEDVEDGGSVDIATSTVVLPKESEERLSVESKASEAINLYIVARAYLDKFLQYDIESGNMEEYSALLDNAIKAFENVDAVSEKLKGDAADLEAASLSSSVDVSGDFDFRFLNPFGVEVYAAEKSDAVKWAEDITARFDAAPVGKGIRTLAEQMGTDAKHAYAQLKQAQDILAGDAYDDFAQTANAAYKTAMALKTAGTAAQLTLSIVTANPTTTVEAVMASGGILVNGINTMLEIGQTGSILIVGEDNKISKSMEKVENAIAPVGSVIGLYGFASNVSKGKELFKDGAALADSLMYLGTSMYDYATEGKILGGSFTHNENGEITCTICETMTLETEGEKKLKEAEEILKTVGYTQEEIAKVQENAGNADMTQAIENDVAEIPLEQIESILEEMSTILPENYVADASISLSDDTAKGEESDDAQEMAADSESEDSLIDDEGGLEKNDGDFPSVDEIPGNYPFYMYMTYGDQSAEGEQPQVVTSAGGNNLVMTDVDGYGLKGTYDSSTGVAVFSDSDGTAVKVKFSYKDGKVHAKLSMGGADMGFSMSGSADKQ